MSGGSFNYLCVQEPDQIMANDSHLQAMADALAALGYADDAAAETEELLLTVRQMRNRISAMARRLSDVHYAVEWWKSGDWSEDQVKDALLKYRGESGRAAAVPGDDDHEPYTKPSGEVF